MIKNKDLLFEELKKAPYFTKEVLSQTAQRYSLSSHTIDSIIKKALLNKELISLKRNFYVHKESYEKNISDISYIYFLANRLRSPSYISLESALQYYGMFPEAVNVVKTSITSKVTREYSNQLGIFKYRSINKDVFSDYHIIKGNFEFNIAKPYKAIFDLLYYRTNRFKANFSEDILIDLRIDTSELKSDETEKLTKMFENFTSKKIIL